MRNVPIASPSRSPVVPGGATADHATYPGSTDRNRVPKQRRRRSAAAVVARTYRTALLRGMPSAVAEGQLRSAAGPTEGRISYPHGAESARHRAAQMRPSKDRAASRTPGHFPTTRPGRTYERQELGARRAFGKVSPWGRRRVPFVAERLRHGYTQNRAVVSKPGGSGLCSALGRQLALCGPSDGRSGKLARAVCRLFGSRLLPAVARARRGRRRRRPVQHRHRHAAPRRGDPRRHAAADRHHARADNCASRETDPDHAGRPRWVVAGDGGRVALRRRRPSATAASGSSPKGQPGTVRGELDVRQRRPRRPRRQPGGEHMERQHLRHGLPRRDDLRRRLSRQGNGPRHRGPFPPSAVGEPPPSGA